MGEMVEIDINALDLFIATTLRRRPLRRGLHFSEVKNMLASIWTVAFVLVLTALVAVFFVFALLFNAVRYAWREIRPARAAIAHKVRA